MDINLTLIGQTIAMIVFVWFCMKFIWPPILHALEERQKQIEEGLAAADLSQEKLSEAEAEADGIPDAAIRPRMLPPDSETLVALPSDSGPPTLPPELPAAVLAEPGVPDPADPALLASVAGPLTVPPPLVPVSGTGGGVSSTPF